MILGTDEAGRGPALGSMFVTAIRGEHNDIPAGIDDSKNFTNKKIFELFEDIKSSPLQYKCVEIPTNRIDNNNLTDVSKQSYVEAISYLIENKDHIYIDAFSNNKSDIIDYMSQNIKTQNELTVEFSADEKYKIVGAASIVSKAKREKHMNSLSENYNYNIGSGYPSDPSTKKFLKEYIKENKKAPNCARMSWKTTTKLLDKYT